MYRGNSDLGGIGRSTQHADIKNQHENDRGASDFDRRLEQCHGVANFVGAETDVATALFGLVHAD